MVFVFILAGLIGAVASVLHLHVHGFDGTGMILAYLAATSAVLGASLGLLLVCTLLTGASSPARNDLDQ